MLTSRSTRDLAVTPTLTLNVATPGHATLVFTGQLDIAPLGHPRALIVIETPGPNGREAVDAPIRVDPHGAFQLHLPKLPLTLHRTFKFRAVTPATALWHNALSRTRSALVR